MRFGMEHDGELTIGCERENALFARFSYRRRYEWPHLPSARECTRRMVELVMLYVKGAYLIDGYGYSRW